MSFKNKYLIWGAIAAIGIWYFFQPHSYEDCVVDGMSNAKTESAMYALRGACRKKFPSEYTNAPTVKKDLLHQTPLPADLKSAPKTTTSFLGIELGDSVADLVYKLNDKSLSVEQLKKLVLMPYKNYWVAINLDSKDRVDVIYLSCEFTTQQIDLNGIYCGNDEQIIKRKFGPNVSLRCIPDRPTVRIAYSAKYKSAYYLEASKVIGLAVSGRSLGEPCP